MLAVEHMRKDKGGNGGLIINVSSAAGITKPNCKKKALRTFR